MQVPIRFRSMRSLRSGRAFGSVTVRVRTVTHAQDDGWWVQGSIAVSPRTLYSGGLVRAPRADALGYFLPSLRELAG